MKNKKSGFTLIELLVSISIIAILTVLASASYVKAQKSSRDQRRIDDLKAIQNAAEQYYLLNKGSYLSGSTLYASDKVWSINGQVILQKYPTDPKNDSANGYVYTASPVPTATSYCVCAKMETGKGGNSELGCSFVDQCAVSPNNCYFCIKNQQ